VKTTAKRPSVKLTDTQLACRNILLEALEDNPSGLVIITRTGKGAGSASFWGLSPEALIYELEVATRKASDLIAENSRAFAEQAKAPRSIH